MSRIRRLIVTVNVGTDDEDSCGECPFRSFDWSGGEPKGLEVCTCPAWPDAFDVSGGVRHDLCISASSCLLDDEETLQKIIALYSAWANGDEPEGAPSARRAMLAIGELFEVPF
jgi:hypothetical protein